MHSLFRAIPVMAKTALAALLLALLWTTPSFADSVTYDYQGPQFTQFFGTDSCSAGVGACSITLSITLSQALADSFNGFVTPTAFTISDGVNTLTEASNALTQFFFQTNSTGTITSWDVSAATRTLANSGAGFPIAGFGFGTSNLAPFADCGSSSSDVTSTIGPTQLLTACADTPFGTVGSWTVASPEPSTLALLLTSLLGLLALVTATRRRIFC